VEPALPQLADEFDDLGERERGDIENLPFQVLDVITFSFAAARGCTL
jgi:hypothetical protein